MLKRTALTASLRVRDCETCGKPFQQARSMQSVCSPRCAVKLPKVKARREKAADKQARERLMTLSDWRKRAQAAMNAWVKLRDAALPCISCGAPPRPDDQAGHFLTRGARPALALDPANVWRQCLRCNLFLHGNVAAYRAGLIERIGLAEVERLEGPNPPRHDTADSLKAIAAEYRAKARALR